MKQILKYIIFIIIGIIIYSYINSYNTFSIGIPFICNLKNYKCNSIPYHIDPIGGIQSQEYTFDDKDACDNHCDNLRVYSDLARRTGGRGGWIREGGSLPTRDVYTLDTSNVEPKTECSVTFSDTINEKDMRMLYLNSNPEINMILVPLLTPPTIPVIDGINRINLFNTSLQDLILLRDTVQEQTTGYSNTFLLNRTQFLIINDSIQLKQILSSNEELNTLYNSLFIEGVFDPNVVKTLTIPQINKLKERHREIKNQYIDKSVFNLGFSNQQQLLILKREYLLNNQEFTEVYNRVINSDGSINSEAEFTDVQTVYTVSNAYEQTIGGKSFLLTNTQNNGLLSLYKSNYLEQNQDIRSLYYRIYAYIDGPINTDAIDEMSREELIQLRDAQYNIGGVSYNLIDPLNDRVVYELIVPRIFAFQYRLDTNIIGEYRGASANIVAMINEDGNVEIKEYSSGEGATGTGEYGLPVINKEELRGLNTRYYLISTELEETGIFRRSIQVTGTLVGIGGKDDNINPYLSILATTFQNPRYLPIDEIDHRMWSNAIVNLHKSEVSEIKRQFQSTEFRLQQRQNMPNILVIPAWLRI